MLAGRATSAFQTVNAVAPSQEASLLRQVQAIKPPFLHADMVTLVVNILANLLLFTFASVAVDTTVITRCVGS